MVPKGRFGGILQPTVKREPLILTKTPKAQQGSDLERMMPIKSLTAPQLAPQLDTSTLEPMQLKAIDAPTTPTGGFNTAGAIGVGATLAGGVIDAVDQPGTDKYGIEMPGSTGAAIGKGAASGAAAGAMFGPWGADIGGVIGGAAGGISSHFAKKKYEEAFNKAKAGAVRTQDAQKFQAMSAKNGMKFGNKINKIVTSKTTMTPVFKLGGRLGENVIAGGKLHKENNNLGNGDKGIPVIDKSGVKKYELEKEEWVINADVTKQIESMAAKYNKSLDDLDLENLGRFVSSQLMSNTLDNSNRYGLGGKS